VQDDEDGAGKDGGGVIRKIDAMHLYFGVTPGEHCKDCCHCISGQYRDKNYRKCEAYGMTHSEATDWAQSWLACGLYNKPYSGERVMERALYDATGRRTAERRDDFCSYGERKDGTSDGEE
jgi:hypothetical protein